MKWGMPFFDYHGPLCALAAFKAHCAFRLWKGDVLESNAGAAQRKAMGPFDHLTALSDLPPRKALEGIVKAAMKLNEEGVKAHWQERRQAKRRATVAVKPPPALVAALQKSAKARATWDAFPPSHRKEYAQWIGEAKREETRAKRVAQTVEWLAEGKSRNWRYEERR